MTNKSSFSNITDLGLIRIVADQQCHISNLFLMTDLIVHGLYTVDLPHDFDSLLTEVSSIVNGVQKVHQLKLNPLGTRFQQLVWDQIRQIPYGETISYHDLATKIGKPKAVRAVANACGANPIPILIPCHRVIRKDGALGGYSGGIEIKKKLLEREQYAK